MHILDVSPSPHTDNTQRHWGVGLLIQQESNMRLSQNSLQYLTSPLLLPGDLIPYCVINKQAVKCVLMYISRCMGVHISLIVCTIFELDSIVCIQHRWVLYSSVTNDTQKDVSFLMCIIGLCSLTMGSNLV